MGRDSTGAWTTDECLRIELKFLLKAKYLVRGQQRYGSLHWNRNGQPSGNINIYSSWPINPNERAYIRLTYVTTDRTTGEKEDREDTIYLEARPSNLGKGEVLYFICPSSGQRCRILYKAYGCRIWKSRQSYQHRIYYPSQQSSKLDYFNTRYWQLDSQLDKLIGKRFVQSYKGKQTKRAARVARLSRQQEEMDALRFSPAGFTISMRNAIFGPTPTLDELLNRGKKGNKT